MLSWSSPVSCDKRAICCLFLPVGEVMVVSPVTRQEVGNELLPFVVVADA